MNPSKRLLALLVTCLLAASLLLSGCKRQVVRDDDGSEDEPEPGPSRPRIVLSH